MPYGIKRGDLDAGAILPSNFGNELLTHDETIYIGTVAIDSDTIVTPIMKTTKAITITSVKFAQNTAQSAADTNYNTIALKNGANTIASIANGPIATGQTFVAGAFYPATVANAVVAAGSTLTMTYTKTGNGLALAGFTVQITYKVNDPA